MPTVKVDKEFIFKQLGREYTTDEFRELCFEFGIELEDDTTEAAMASEMMGSEKAQGLSTRPLYLIDIPANRYDLLCPEGIARSLRIYSGLSKPPTYKVVAPPNGNALEKIVVQPQTASIRPFVVGAILRNVNFDEFRYNNFIELQDKLHNNICRKRTLVAIGTHDYDTIKGPFSYEALPPKDINFVPLNQTEKMDGNRLMEFYEADRHLGKFLHIIRDSPVYPVIYDSSRTVLSLPPIINGDLSKIKLTTKNVFIECTATDAYKAKVVLNMVVTMFSEYCAEPFTVEPVEVVYPDGKRVVTPDLSIRQINTTAKYITSSIGVDLSPEKVVQLLDKMSLSGKLHDDKNTITISIPPTRSDVLHACDVMEDVAIAYGFNNIPKTLPATNTIAAPFVINKLSDMIRKEVALAGFSEVLPLILCSHDENFGFLRKKDDNSAVLLANPKTVEYQVVRTSLLPGILKTVRENKKMALPLKVFEVSDVVHKDDSIERRARNQRRFCALYMNKTSGFEQIHGLLDRVMAMLNVPMASPGGNNGYFIRESEHSSYFPGRRADVFYNGAQIGEFGVVHPEVLEKFEIPYPCSVLEINVEPFL